MIDDDRAHADDRTIRIFALAGFGSAGLRGSRSDLESGGADCELMLALHGSEKKDRGCTSTNFQLSPHVGNSKVQPLISARDGSAVAWLSFHLGVNGNVGFVAVNRRINQIEVDADGFGLRERKN